MSEKVPRELGESRNHVVIETKGIEFLGGRGASVVTNAVEKSIKGGLRGSF